MPKMPACFGCDTTSCSCHTFVYYDFDHGEGTTGRFYFPRLPWLSALLYTLAPLKEPNA